MEGVYAWTQSASHLDFARVVTQRIYADAQVQKEYAFVTEGELCVWDKVLMGMGPTYT